MRTYQIEVSPGGQPAVQVYATFQPAGGSAVVRLSAAENETHQAVVTDDGSCQLSALIDSVPLAQRWEPASLLPGVSGARNAGDDDIQGVNAHHYTFDENALGLNGLVQAAGEIWVEPESGLVLRYILSEKSGEEYFGEGLEGSLNWEYSLERDNANPTWPAGCTEPILGFDLPTMPDAEEINYSPGLLSFRVRHLPGEVMAYYEPMLVDNGWLPGKDQAPSGAGGILSLPGLEGMLDEETLLELEELQSLIEEEDLMTDVGEGSVGIVAANPSDPMTVVYHREGQELTLTFLPRENVTQVFIAIIQQ